MDETVGGGLHYVYLSKVKPNPISHYHATHALEIIAGAKLCIMAPSKGYKPLNDNTPTIIEDAKGLFYQILSVQSAKSKEAFVLI